MEEDIKILEESIIQGKYHLYKKDLKKCVSNVIKAYKELEEYYEEQNEVNAKFIPVSLVEETIEELNKQEQKLQDSISDEEREEYSDANISFELMDIEIRRSVLQELLEKR